MTPDPATLARIVRATVPLFTRFLADFDAPGRSTAQAAHLPNHAVWSLGHCALTMAKLTGMIDGSPLPQADWRAPGTPGDAMRFDPETVSFGSVPVGEASVYPGLGRARAIYEGAGERLALAVELATADVLLRRQRWGAAEYPLADLVPRVVFHNGTHVGQLIDLRRALGMPRLLG